MNTTVHDPAKTAYTAHVQPFVYEDTDTKALHFTIHQQQSLMRISHPHALQVDYTQVMMGYLLLHRHPRHIAMIGLGGGSLAKFCHHHFPATRFTAVEINPHVIAMRREFLIPDDNDRFRVIEADGADYIANVAGQIDVLLLDGFDHQGQPAQLCSLQFYEACKQALAPGGVLVVNLHDTHALYAVFLARLDTVFAGNIAEVATNEDGNVIVFASHTVRITPAVLRAEVQKYCADWPSWIARNA
jgi:spermidine synthase